MKKTFLINDLFWIGFAGVACWGGLSLGFGSFQEPHAGFMPFLAGAVLGLLALIDLISGLANRWKNEKEDREIWSGIRWGKLLLTMGLLFLYTAFFSTLGFVIGTVPLLLYLFRVVEPRTWRVTVLASLLTTGLFYLAFKVGLDAQLPRGFLGF